MRDFLAGIAASQLTLRWRRTRADALECMRGTVQTNCPAPHVVISFSCSSAVPISGVAFQFEIQSGYPASVCGIDWCNPAIAQDEDPDIARCVHVSRCYRASASEGQSWDVFVGYRVVGLFLSETLALTH